MDKSAHKLKELVTDEIIRGRVIPNIYAFSTNTIPNYLKIGDTFRAVAVRLEEWRKFFPELQQQFASPALVNEETYFRDYAIHHYLEKEMGKYRLQRADLEGDIVYSNEFFKDVSCAELEQAIADIKSNYEQNTGKYNYYSVDERLLKGYHYKRGPQWTLRPNQAQAVHNFRQALSQGRTNLLMYAVMRFGKSFTSLCCALEMNAKLVVVVSAKADVGDEWKKTVETAGNFANFVFLDSTNLVADRNCIRNHLYDDKTVVVFLTLQDLQGPYIKGKHQELFSQQIDMVIVDETHFGARAPQYGAVLQEAGYDTYDFKNQRKIEAEVTLEEAAEVIKELRSTVRLHLSGTPYRILMGSEFAPEDIIAFVQFSDIVAEQEQWDAQHLHLDDVNEWDNPYFGFPQMVRFAFNLSKQAQAKLAELQASGISVAFSKLLAPQAIKHDPQGRKHRLFLFEAEVLELLKSIDGSHQDANVFGFLDYDKIQQGQMCRHMVMVLPYCASCDAMEELLRKYRPEFKNLGEYEILNISGLDGSKQYKTPQDIKTKIKECETANRKTITLTVNRMLTGSTVEEWDTMIFLKDTASPQEYDQAIFRLQNQYVQTLTDGKDILKVNLKPQTLLVDFDPMRLFRMQEQKSLIYNVNVADSGNTHLRERIEQELRISPIIVINRDRLELVEAVNILEAVSEYNQQRSVFDEVSDVPVDISILKDLEVKQVILSQAEFNSKQGLTINPSNEQTGTDVDIPELKDAQGSGTEPHEAHHPQENAQPAIDTTFKVIENKIKTYYQRILFFAFLVEEQVLSLDDIKKALQHEENQRIARNLGLEERIITRLIEVMDPFKRNRLDYKIQNISLLAHDESMNPLERVTTSLRKFNKISIAEIMSPVALCDEMVATVGDDYLLQSLESGEKFLDIASKSGEFAVSLYKRLTEQLNLPHDKVCNAIYSIATSPIAYEFTRRFYDILGLNVKNIASLFSAYDLIDFLTNHEHNYEELSSRLLSSPTYSSLDLHAEQVQDTAMKFGLVVGNPPYQKNNDMRNRDDAIYHLFMELGYKLARRSVFVTPARFLLNVGSTPSQWNQKMLQDPHFKVDKYVSKSADIFDNVDIKGGIAITSRFADVEGEPIEFFIHDENLRDIYNKVKAVSNDFEHNFSQIMQVQNKFNLQAVFADYPHYQPLMKTEKRITSAAFAQYPELFHSEVGAGEVQIYGRLNNERCYLAIDPRYLESSPNLNYYKVLVTSANGTGELGETLSTPIIAPPGVGYTQTFIGLGRFTTEFEAQALLKYLKTRFARLLLGLKKTTQNNKTPETWSKIPLQDFTPQADLDWNASVAELDQQLFAKYGLSTAEQEYILSKVKEMV